MSKIGDHGAPGGSGVGAKSEVQTCTDWCLASTSTSDGYTHCRRYIPQEGLIGPKFAATMIDSAMRACFSVEGGGPYGLYQVVYLGLPALWNLDGGRLLLEQQLEREDVMENDCRGLDSSMGAVFVEQHGECVPSDSSHGYSLPRAAQKSWRCDRWRIRCIKAVVSDAVYVEYCIVECTNNVSRKVIG